MHSLFFKYLLIWRPAAYAGLFLGMILEGDAVLFAAAFLAHQKIFNPFIAFAVALSGVLFGDFLWYRLGEGLSSSSSRLSRWASQIAEPFDEHLSTRPFRTIFVSKFTYGLHHLILMRAGARKLNLKNFFRIDSASSLLWIAVIGALGYSSSASLEYIKHSLRFGEIALLVGLFAFLFLERVVSTLFKRRL